MRSLLSLFLCVLLLLPSIPVQAEETFDVERDCKDGQCVDELLGVLKAKIRKARADKCLPPGGSNGQATWFEENPITVECFKLNKEIEELLQKLEYIQSHFNQVLSSGQCQECQEAGLGFDLANIDQIANDELTCTEAKQARVWDNCATDAACVFVASITSISFIPASAKNKMIPESLRDRGCDAREDDCFGQFATAFADSVLSFLTSAGRLLGNFWDWITGAEDQSSTGQLAMANASEDEGVFRMLINDFPGTMAKLWQGLVASLKHWLANDVFCQEWTGTPHFSECRRPATGFGCLECDTMLTGLCSFAGAFVSQIVPAFLTGGLVTCAKYGVSAASRVSKLFKVSTATMNSLRTSKLATSMAEKSARISRVFRLQAVTTAVRNSVGTINAFMSSGAGIAIKYSIATMKQVARSGRVFVMLTNAGPLIIFGQKAARVAGKVILFPIENAMTVRSFQLGITFFEGLFSKVGQASLFGGIRPLLTGPALKAMSAIDDAYIEMRVTKLTRGSYSQAITDVEVKFIRQLRLNRGNVIDSYLEARPQVALEKLIDELYPELNYGRYSKHLRDTDILKAEGDLFDAIGRMPPSAEKDRLLRELQEHMSSSARADSVVGSASFTRSEVMANAGLDEERRIQEAFKAVGIDVSKLNNEASSRLINGLKEAHEHGNGGVFNYSYAEVNDKFKILREAGYTDKQAEILIRGGFAGKLRPEDALDALSQVAVPSVTPTEVQAMAASDDYKLLLTSLTAEKQASMARALKVLEEGGMSPAQAAETVKRFEGNFVLVQNMAYENSDAPVMLAEFIKRQKASGVADDVIERRLNEVFKSCR